VTWLRCVLELAGDLVGPVPDTARADAPAGLPVTTWGTPRTLATWSGPAARGLAWRQRAAELQVVAASRGGGRVGERAVRELLALQSSDWAFLASRDTAGPYPLERAVGHERELTAALADPDAPAALRGLAPWLEMSAIDEP
jgi:1,4-alpha-glucan branching enzyme